MAIKVYALTTCPYCRMARQYLDDKGVRYEVVEVDTLRSDEKRSAVEEVRRLSGGTSFPVLVADGEVVVGFDRVRIGELVGVDG